ncbi:MAG TPA: LLM class flavin-dependent oxidoreductase [Acidimicrobiia bacterium]|nr:LLM class flavin-dependent oxidoreductase [Acidimicrobiia bacterium]
MKLGLALPSFVEDPDIPIAVARAAEAAGLDGVFVYDHVWRDIPPPRRPALECFSLLGAVAAETTTISVGTLVARATLRPAATLAAAFETVHRVSGGRLIAAIGAGDSQSRAENEAFGLPFGTIEDRCEALAHAAQAASGRGFPVWIGGHARHVLDVVALADGWNGWGGTPADYARFGRRVLDVAPDVMLTWGGLICLDADDDAARTKATARNASPNVLVGGPARLAAQLAAYGAAGAQWAVVAPLDASNAANAHRLGEVAGRL